MKKIILILLMILSAAEISSQTIRVGAKHFNEGYILSEILSRMLELNGYTVERNFSLGGTLICYEALKNNDIDLYPEYSGTISEAILKLREKTGTDELKKKLNDLDLDISGEYGFNNTYALAVKRSTAEKYGLNNISDLRDHPELKIGLSYEFLKREDGWKNLSVAYDLKQIPGGLEHGLAYKALDDGQIMLTDVYSTDGEIPKYDLKILNDDKNFFPDYSAVTFYRTDLNEKIKTILNELTGKISENEMQEMNSMVLFENKTFSEVAAEFLKNKKIIGSSDKREVSQETNIYSEIFPKLIQHLKLTFIALLLSVLIAVPAGIFIYRYSSFSKPVLYLSGLLQTIPSIALLAFMIPLFGIGFLPAVIALFIYGLLPILRNTTTGLFTVDPLLKEVADGMGMTSMQKLYNVELPLAMPAILAGIRTAAVINIGTATLAAFIGAGGLGEFIVTGLALNNTKLILMGAIPAALLAILTELIFEIIERMVSPKHLLRSGISTDTV
ncbi:MAG: ABC transporter permease subunit [Bacteroidetes bacterium]|nr:ABC transporter permease subunit [Bacteroidota bacterium]